MKNSTLFIIAILSVFLLSSCSSISDFSITKRHYRSGYYVNLHSKQNSKIANQIAEQKTTNESEQPSLLFFASASEDKSQEINAPVVSETSFGTDNEKIAALLIANNKNASAPFKNNIKKSAIKKAFVKNITKTKYDGGLGDFIWALIGILVLVFLLSLILGGWGLGGLIYIFLVAALVLLLFRLLEIL
jgi:hypothetical protein